MTENMQYAIIVSVDTGLRVGSNRRQAITGTSDDPSQWRIYKSVLCKVFKACMCPGMSRRWFK